MRSSCPPPSASTASRSASPTSSPARASKPACSTPSARPSQRAEELGASVREVSLPHAPHALSAYYVLAPAEASSNLARFDGVRYGMRAPDAEDLLDMYTSTRHDGFGAEVKRRIMLGTYALSSGYYDAYYSRAQRVRTKISDDFRAAFADVDFIVTPTAPTVAFKLGEKTARPTRDVPQRLLHRAHVARRHPRHLDPLRPQRRTARRPTDRRPRVQREPSARRRPRDRTRHSPSTGAALVSEYEPVIGLEIHVQLATATKMFCGCELSFGEAPNTRTCPVCLGLPGSLPVVNARAVHFGLMIGLALGSKLAPRSIFHRKNYFYPDLPKGYQISQYDEPLCLGGQLADVRIHRVHLEEDAAKLTHVGSSGRIHGSDASIVDFNRGGTPLAEIVTEPDVRSAEQASAWLKLLRSTLRALGVSDVNMEEGSLRCDANISLRPVGSDGLGVKTELKNMNSFRFIERGIRAEIARQEKILAGGGTVTQETLHFDPASGAITSLRSKEEAHDYRYFPEPDLLPVAIEPAMVDAARADMSELPADRAERLAREHSISEESAQVLAFRAELGDFFEAALAAGTDSAASAPPAEAPPAQALANWITGELVARLEDGADPADSNVTPGALASLVAMVAAKRVSSGAARSVLDTLVADGGDPETIVEDEGLAAMDDSSELEAIVAAALAANGDAAERVRQGNAKAIGPIVGHVMRETKGRADGTEVARLINAQLGI